LLKCNFGVNLSADSSGSPVLAVERFGNLSLSRDNRPQPLLGRSVVALHDQENTIVTPPL